MFDLDAAGRLITKLRLIYGAKFDKQWANVDPRELQNTMVDMFSDLTAIEFKRGLEALQTHVFCPSLPEFKALCRPAKSVVSGYLSPAEAWAHAQKNLDERNSFETYSEIQEAWYVASTLETNYDRSRAFNETYSRLVALSEAQGTFAPTWYFSEGSEPQELRAIAYQAAIDSGRIEATQAVVAHIGYLADSKAVMSEDVSGKIEKIRAMLEATEATKKNEAMERQAMFNQNRANLSQQLKAMGA